MDVLAKKILDLNFDPKLEESRVVLSQVLSYKSGILMLYV
jgi:hypothetical protein